MRIIAIANQKGGVGKTSLSLNIGSAAQADGMEVLLVDCDPQASLREWAQAGAARGVDGPPVVGMEAGQLRRDLRRVAKTASLIIIDCPPRLGREMRAAMIEADLVLVPVAPGVFDTWAAAQTLELIQEARSLRPELKAAVVVNRGDRTQLAKTTEAAVRDFGVPVLDASISQRVAIGEAAAQGESVVTGMPNSDAAREVRRLWKELRSVLEVP